MEKQFVKPKQLKIILDESEHDSYKSLYEEIVLEAKKNGMAGATVLKGTMNYGQDGEVYTFKIFSIAQELPVIIEIIDSGEKIDMFLDKIDEIFKRNSAGGIVTVSPLDIVRHYPTKE